MRRVITIAMTSLGLAGCGGTLFPGPAPIPIAFQSTPSGAEARTSTGLSCKTPCSLNLPAPDGDFTVSFSLRGFEPMTIPVQITRSAGSALTPPFTTLNPNPVVAQLQPIGPPPGRLRKKPAAAQ